MIHEQEVAKTLPKVMSHPCAVSSPFARETAIAHSKPFDSDFAGHRP